MLKCYCTCMLKCYCTCGVLKIKTCKLQHAAWKNDAIFHATCGWTAIEVWQMMGILNCAEDFLAGTIPLLQSY